MYTSKLFTVLRTFDETEWKDCQKFLTLYGSAKTDTAQLYKYIYTYRKNLDQKKLDATICRDKLFSHLSDKSFRNILSKLHRIVEDYIVWQRVKSDQHVYDLQLFEALDDRGVDQQADKIAVRITNSIAQNDAIDIQRYYVQHKIAHSRFYSDNPTKYKDGKQILFDASLGLTNYYDAVMNQYKAEMHNCSIIYNDNWISQWEQLIIKKEHSDEYNLTSLLIKIISEPNEQIYNELFHILKTRELSLELSQITLVSLTKYLKHFNYKGQRLKEHFELMKFGLDKGIYLDQGTISSAHYWNILNMACSLNEIEWAKAFNAAWVEKLSTEDYQDLSKLSEVRILFAQERFIDCLRFIAANQLDKLINQRVLMKYKIMSIIECFANEEDYCLEELRKYQSWFKKSIKKQYELKHKITNNFIHALKLLIRQDIGELEQFIGDSAIPYRSWFLKKLEAHKAPSM